MTMTDFMLIGTLRMPIEADDGVVAFTQFRSAARSAADRIEALTAERDEALNQLDGARYSVEVLEKRVADLQADNARLRADMRHIVTYVAEPSDLDGDTINALRADLRFVGHIARAALNTGKADT